MKFCQHPYGFHFANYGLLRTTWVKVDFNLTSSSEAFICFLTNCALGRKLVALAAKVTAVVKVFVIANWDSVGVFMDSVVS